MAMFVKISKNDWKKRMKEREYKLQRYRIIALLIIDLILIDLLYVDSEYMINTYYDKGHIFEESYKNHPHCI